MFFCKPRVSYEKDKNHNASGIFTFVKEDHVLGTLLHSYLVNQDPQVTFAYYKVPHPLCPQMVFGITTDQRSSPHRAMIKAFDALDRQCEELERAFDRALSDSDETVAQTLE